MQNNKKQEVEQLFSTLPTFVKESIEQSGLNFETKEDLERFVENLNRKS